ncbi:hypothetical protein [Burkholderia sp. Cy-637]|uniref:hypothetical protein n=1 Tax=Burkholderia sp. Cy-637 TaxID=2608327 RepID=UPI001F04D3BD|nr:hypothetical protein [Burkholderia sp. Cy-637]
MDALGLPAPASLFSAQQTAAGTLATILGAIGKLGADATIGEIIGATTKLELLAVISALSASYYAGAIIGSLMVATGASVSCTNTVAAASHARQWAAGRGIFIPPIVYRVLVQHPEIFTSSHIFAFRARLAGARANA